MEAGVTASCRGILDKPLSQLTEDDISQLTREDCRKYLKEKGMRRPSWNKAQAIQQVISLKALLETSDDSGAGALRRIIVSKPPPPPVNSNSAGDSAKEPPAAAAAAAADANDVISASETSNCQQNDSRRSATPPPSGQVECPPEEADDKAAPAASSSPGSTNAPIRQMTIFYCGKVNVYDAVPPDKAQAIMHLAATPIQFTLNDPNLQATPLSVPCHLQTPSDTHNLILPGATSSQPTQTEVEGPGNRKVSLQRYREKRKDRGRFKVRKTLGSSPSSMEAYLNHQVKANSLNVQSAKSNAFSSQTEVPHAASGSADHQSKIANISVDLNEDVPEC